MKLSVFEQLANTSRATLYELCCSNCVNLLRLVSDYVSALFFNSENASSRPKLRSVFVIVVLAGLRLSGWLLWEAEESSKSLVALSGKSICNTPICSHRNMSTINICENWAD